MINRFIANIEPQSYKGFCKCFYKFLVFVWIPGEPEGHTPISGTSLLPADTPHAARYTLLHNFTSMWFYNHYQLLTLVRDIDLYLQQ